MKLYRKIDLYVQHRSSNFASGYTDFKYACSTQQHRTLASAIKSLKGTSYIVENPGPLPRRCPAGTVCSTEGGYENILAIVAK